jgi:hypothetical protein
MKIIKLIFFTFIISISFSANAILHVEPHLGYALLGIGQDENVPAKTLQYNGAQYGLKLGAQYLNGMAGIDFNHSSFDQLTNGYTNDFSRNEFGMFAGYNFPAIARIWITYFFSSTSTANSSSDLIASGDKYEGYAMEIGGGYNGLPYVSLNLAIRFVTLNEFITSSSTTKLSGSNEINNHELVFSVSSPFNFF